MTAKEKAIMSTVTTIILVLGLAATALFVAGFLRGLRQALDSRNHASKDVPVSENEHWPSVIFAVIVSALAIAAVGFTSAAVYVGPFLVLLTAAGTGLAFFLDHPDKSVS